jgi:hypothetical protein
MMVQAVGDIKQGSQRLDVFGGEHKGVLRGAGHVAGRIALSLACNNPWLMVTFWVLTPVWNIQVASTDNCQTVKWASCRGSN